MKLIVNIVLAVLLLASVIGCGKKDDTPAPPPAKAAETGVFKEQMEALDQAKQVGQILQDGADQQRQKIEEQSQ
ncbi:hypothetical protein [Candidatus Methylobacter oryzae]|uniref:Lipoprotein n=1 Tax=Candidatus Methylobacter oryzae TaxID=2497749 RepID=A0ABY3CDK9_9GAMM|nr:hypothetical protein [Candidatus Methylobacter oryzae]TRX00716.1 hypothetical protein EKO24_005185 [Candidatus Methylobacter oryzae]